MCEHDCGNFVCGDNSNYKCKTHIDTKSCSRYIPLAVSELLPAKKKPITRIYEDDDFIIDRFMTSNGPAIRVSIFEDGHFVDDVHIHKSGEIKQYCE